MKDQRDEIHRYFRDLVRMTTEVISKHYSRDTLSAMTGLKFPTQEQKQAAQMQIQMQMMMASQTGQPPKPPPPEVQQMLETPSWEDIEQIIKSDLERTYRIDIETDSTVQADQQKDQEAITELMRAIMEFFQAAAPAIQSGFLSLDLAKNMLLTAVRRYDLGRELEDAIEDIEMPQQQQGPDPAEEAEKAKAAAEMQKIQMEMQVKQKEHQLEMEKLARQEQVDKAEHERKMREMAANVRLNESKSENVNGRAQ